jgi:hypothetical protein
MTLIGKLLALLNLVFGLGILTWSVSVYTQRPGWFDPVPESISAGQSPESFAMMKADIETLLRTAASATANRNTQRKMLEDLELKRVERQKKYAERLNWARNGNPADSGNGFYEPVYEKDSGLLDLATVGAPIRGTDNLPLKGSEKLMTNFHTDVEEVSKLSQQIVEKRREFEKLGVAVLFTEERLLKMIEIRESVVAEALFLATFETSTKLERLVVNDRKKQLSDRLDQLKGNK